MKNLFLLVLGMLLVACANSTPAASTETSALQIVKPDGSTKGFSLDDLKALPKTKITVEGSAEEGPALLEVLRAAGVTDFKQVTLGGSGALTLTKDKVTPQVLLDFTNRGTVKFAAANVPKANWPKDITTIKVE
ncbi:MAG: hypothetical protein AB1817_18745 [Chloroflexota bacterium]